MNTKLNSAVGLLLTSAVVFCTAGVRADEVVSVASLEVKERIRTIDQINVSAATEKVAEAPSSEAVAELLQEAEEIDAAQAAPEAE